VDQPANRYDLVPYNSLPFRQTHPNRLATVATLMGLQPPPVARARVLELGCGCGDNLIPLGLELPQAELVGIDLSEGQVGIARQAITELGVANVRIEQGDILDLPADLGVFDYVIAHGVYSWLPDEVRDALMAACHAHLAPTGIAFVSYNALPGWRIRGIARDAMLFHTRAISDTEQRIREADAFVEFMARVVPEPIHLYRAMWRNLLDSIDTPVARRALLFHDFLAPDNTPVYFWQFAAHAARHRLRFVADALFSDMSLNALGDEVKRRLDALDDDVVSREQYRDFITNRPFRQTLLCHESLQPRVWPDPDAVRHLFVGSDLDGMNEEDDPTAAGMMRFVKGGTEVGLQQPVVKTALLVLREHWPRPLRFDELLRRARAHLRPGRLTAVSADAWQAEERSLATELLELYTADLVELDIAPPRFAAEPGERPVASAWARRQLRNGGFVCNLRHNGVDLDELATVLLALLDGSRDHAALVRDLAAAVAGQKLVLTEDGRELVDRAEIRDTLARRLPGILDRMCQLALLCEPAGESHG